VSTRVIFIGALVIKIRDRVVANRPGCLAIGVDCEGAKRVLGLWAGPTTGELAKFWLTVLNEPKGRAWPTCASCCDGLTGLPEAILVTCLQAVMQLCVVHTPTPWLCRLGAGSRRHRRRANWRSRHNHRACRKASRWPAAGSARAWLPTGWSG